MSPERPTRVCLVAGGGAVKAYVYHLGVLRGMEADGFHFRSGLRWEPKTAPPGAREVDTYVGSSAGGCIVASLAAGHPVSSLQDALRGKAPGVPKFGYQTLFVPVAPNPFKYARGIVRRWRAGGLRPHHLVDPGGLFTTAGVERYFRRHVLPTNRFVDLAPDLFLTATPVNAARKVVFGPVDSLNQSANGEVGYDRWCAYYDNVEISQALAASVAVPPMFAPWAIVNPSSGERYHYYDGEVREALSTHVAADVRADFVIASSIWGALPWDHRLGSLGDYGMTVLAEQALHQLIEQKVGRVRRLQEQYDRLLTRLEQHDAAHGVPPEATAAFKAEVCGLLGHRRMRMLFVEPDPQDIAFFFGSFFRFEPSVVEQGVAAGKRAWRRAVESDPAFVEELDAALSAG